MAGGDAPLGAARGAPVPARVRPGRRAAVAATEGEWTAVRDDRTGEVYYWNRTTNETTALGEPRPGPEGRVVSAPYGAGAQQPAAGGLGSSILQIFVMGFGVSIGFAIIGRIFGGMAHEEEGQDAWGPDATVHGMAGARRAWASGLGDEDGDPAPRTGARGRVCG